ncbi:FAD-dependent oxidoreductase [Mesorhizobium sp. MSK_1335]|uniref:FAD-dependent oxidoreductase n=1 Tax=Mesorhizobium montanum TaxID=3072323 RepID=A0ABU4ZJ47_9HYPH|nr:FAD-dependent oxidoreductase [Mesorhizobium sp. MSK_1335]MDX8525394.1 FAD-dependent oxidoreductase [Mesorhizobium sp. MSK_1335]
MTKIIHPLAGMVVLLTIATFWLSTVLSELFASEATIIAVKTAIPWGFLLLIPALAATGGSGFALAKGGRSSVIGKKLKRMPFIAANGLLVLIPAALFLASRAKAGDFDIAFYTVQALELIAGATNITLLGLNMRDGMKLTRWRRKSFLRPASTFSTSLTAREEVAKGTMAFHLKKPEGFVFEAGQAIYMSLPDLKATDAKGQVRTFSIVSGPHEPELMIATRLTDTSFKHGLMSLPLGTTVEIEGPYGDLSLHEDAARPAVFLAGGIGITPFRSMIIDATKRGLPQRLFLFYGNRRVEDAAFLSELTEIARQNPRFNLVATCTEADGAPAEWRGEQGYITQEMISKYVGDIAAPVYYVAGPEAMVSAMQTLLREAGVKGKDVKMETFLGY